MDSLIWRELIAELTDGRTAGYRRTFLSGSFALCLTGSYFGQHLSSQKANVAKATSSATPTAPCPRRRLAVELQPNGRQQHGLVAHLNRYKVAGRLLIVPVTFSHDQLL
ncbi:hypothetical protein J6590_032738 [Homalodisca vitripennis]|nr:hypothetical protein J6590_032738 [Homalodisca vitripennis]